MRRYQPLRKDLGFNLFRARFLARIERAHAFQKRFLESPPDRHHFSHRLHLRTQVFVRPWEFLELPLGNLHHDIVERRLEARRSLARDVVRYLVEGVPNRKLGGNLRNRKSGGLRSQCRRPRNARVHFDDHHPPRTRMDAELDVRSAGLHTDFAHNRQRRIAHHLVFAVGQSLRRSDGNRVARVHAHWIEVLDRADDDDVVFRVAHHLQLEFFPSQHRLFDERFVHWREIQSSRQQIHQLFAVVSDTTTTAPECEGRSNDDWKADLPGELQPIFQIVHQRRLGNVEADLLHGVLEEKSVLRLLYGTDLRTNQLHVVLFENPAVGKLDRKIQSSLPAHRRQNGEAGAGRDLALDAENLFQVVASKRFDVSTIREIRIRHDGGRVGIRQHHFIPFGLQRLASLRAGVIKLRRLANDDGARADNQDFGDVSSFGQLWLLHSAGCATTCQR